ncbi:MAG TPA: PIN domain-containing protein [Thermoanaerobaculia bacterium]|nr:PIN domain-containing protein [Thermoanaerobaculia bacterium]
MKAAYVDTSVLVAVAFGEAGSRRLTKSLRIYDRLLASNLLEAELRSVLHRERIAKEPADFLSAISWVHPDRTLTAEMVSVLSVGYVRGADLWHLAVALFVDPKRELAFLTLDERQREVSRKLGFGR